ncbi:uncharacterized protein LOC131620178 [Vicia villosa]|uniref:uncharacterized protein LOC131620178 n=1 Tax=Vicia villosa TaxID=3911 RepID=UPI00273AE40C|nr:uncharacterized protein LOC131620178 [Vicia villosa]
MKQRFWFWKTDVPFKIKAFGWRLLANRLPTKDLLAIRGIPLSFDASLCSFCKIDSENRDRSFFSCSFVKNIWRDIAVWIGKEGLVEDESHSSFMEWHSFCISKKVLDKKVDIVWLAITWALWLSRNEVCFREEVWSFDNVVWNIKALMLVIALAYLFVKDNFVNEVVFLFRFFVASNIYGLDIG